MSIGLEDEEVEELTEEPELVDSDDSATCPRRHDCQQVEILSR